MTLYHFGNCIALVYAPYYMTYKYSGLSEFGSFSQTSIRAGMVYVLTQLFKMFILATCFDLDTFTEDYNFFTELIKSVIDAVDLLGFAFILSTIPGKGHDKLIVTGLGWATAEVVLSRGLMLWIGARGLEFSWIYIQKCLESNILLGQHIATATLVWLFRRHDLNRKMVPLVNLLLIATVFKGVWLGGLLNMFTFGIWSGLAFSALATSFIGFVTLNIYSGLAQQIGI